jgi:hypothetical protein
MRALRWDVALKLGERKLTRVEIDIRYMRSGGAAIAYQVVGSVRVTPREVENGAT